MDDFNQRKAEQYLNQPLPDLMGELALYDDAQRGVSDLWQRVAAPLRRPICDEWNWCNVRQDSRFENDYDIYVAVVSLLATRVLHMPLDADVYLIAAILVKRGLDAFCGCP